MTPIQSAWSSGPWWRYDTEPPGVPPVTITADDGTAWVLSEPVPPDWHAAHVRHGAEIHDHERSVTYRATVDPETSDLDHLEVIVHGWIDDNAMKRVPVARIRRVVLAQVAADAAARASVGHDDVFTVVLPGGLAPRVEGTRYAPPPLAEVAELVRNGLDRHALAERYGRKLRTVDGWIRRARQHFPDQMPARTSGRRRPKTPGGTSSPGDHNK